MDEFEFDFEIPEPEPEETIEELEPVYNRHYITVDEQGLITDGWSDGPHPERDTADVICINEQGGYQFRLEPTGEENPSLYTTDGIPLYKWDGEQVIRRTEDELAADCIPPLETVQANKLAELSEACSKVIIAGCDVTLSSCAGHIALTAEDQINLSTAMSAVEQGAAGYPYHLDGQLCAIFPGEDITAMAQAATVHKLYHTTYYNHLAAWVRRCKSVEEVQAITYGSELPEDLAANMAAVLASTGGEGDV